MLQIFKLMKKIWGKCTNLRHELVTRTQRRLFFEIEILYRLSSLVFSYFMSRKIPFFSSLETNTFWQEITKIISLLNHNEISMLRLYKITVAIQCKLTLVILLKLSILINRSSIVVNPTA